ncbi:hypothetical protein Cgig2_001716 [Carnegiea gigantea]|uniref:Uncharacterized protein n=1 Tax=Carnegiea gigantea TaxID=171969 RepID=A0A9Q1Q884_9CARY|nr:hypothetical protein Cgig2_001716 [Carnegiea gigantea]
MLRNKYSQKGDQVIAIACSERGRSQSKRRGAPRERSQYRPNDMSNIECIVERSATFKIVVLKKIRGKAELEDEDGSNANVIDKGDVFLAKSAQERVDDSIEGNRLILQGEKDKKNICHLIGCLVKGTTDDSKWFEKRKRVRFSNVIEVFGNESKTLVVPPK